MPYSKTQLANLGLSHFGSSQIDSIETDQSEAGRASREFFEISLETFMQAHDWPWGRKRAVLGLVAAAPNVEWPYVHRVPADCVALRRIASGQRVDDESSEIFFEQGFDAGGKLVYSDLPNPEAIYTAVPADVAILPPDAALALSFKQAQLVAGRLVREDAFEIVRRMEREYEIALERAKLSCVRSEKSGPPPDPSWLRARR